MELEKLIDIKRPHHAYLIESADSGAVQELILFLGSNDIKCHGNPDFFTFSGNSFGIDDAKNIKMMQSQRSSEGKKIFIIEVNKFTIEAQNTLLKVFEEPTENTIFFIVAKDATQILPTLLSRMFLVKTSNILDKDVLKKAESFLISSPQKRIDFVADMMKSSPDPDKGASEANILEFKRSLTRLLDGLEYQLHEKFKQDEKQMGAEDVEVFTEILKCRRYLSMSSASVKMIFEHLALILPRVYT